MTTLHEVVRMALEEDAPWGDVTSEALVPSDATARGDIVARAPGVLGGVAAAEATFLAAGGVGCDVLLSDGSHLRPGARVLHVEGSARSVLRGERVALNFLQRLSGIATLTARYVALVEGTGVRITDTRKTTPGLRHLERDAVRAGGGYNHRFSLSDAVLAKDNHLIALAELGIGLTEALLAARRRIPHAMTIEVEVDSLSQIDAALDGGADAILLDNFPPEDMRKAVELVAGRALVEASGRVTLDTVRAIAETGVDVISVGALTHSATALDLALDLEVRQ